MQPTSTSLATVPDSFPNGNLPVLYAGDQETSATTFASRINLELGSTARGVQNIAIIVNEAKVALSSDSYLKLSKLTGLSPSTLSKYLSIYSKRDRFAPYIDRLPPSWTIQYELSAIRDETFKKLVAEEKLRPDLTTKQLYAFIAEVNRRLSDLAREDATQSDLSVAEPAAPVAPTLRTVAVIKISCDSSQDVANAIKEQIAVSLTDPLVHIEFPMSKGSIQQQRSAIALGRLQLELAEILAESDAHRASLNEAEYQAIENAAFQHHHKTQKGTFPYAPNDRRSIEHPDHSYSLAGQFSSPKLFYKHLHSLRIITAYSPAADFGQADEARSVKLGIDYCEARTPKAKSLAKKELQRIATEDPANCQTAKRILRMIFGEAF